MQFFESFSSFPSEIDKKQQIQIFYCLIINFLSLVSRWKQHQRLNFLKRIVLTLTSTQFLRYNRLKLHFFFIFKCQFFFMLHQLGCTAGGSAPCNPGAAIPVKSDISRKFIQFLKKSLLFSTLFPLGYTTGGSTPYSPKCCCEQLAELKELMMRHKRFEFALFNLFHLEMRKTFRKTSFLDQINGDTFHGRVAFFVFYKRQFFKVFPC